MITLARKVPARKGDFYLNAPETVRVYRSGIKFQLDDINRFALAVVLTGQVTEQFATPLTAIDRMYWTNGLDGVTTIAESILLFKTEDEAISFSQRVKLTSAHLYKLRLDAVERTVWLDLVREHFEQTA